jgi:hypothetical protein
MILQHFSIKSNSIHTEQYYSTNILDAVKRETKDGDTRINPQDLKYKNLQIQRGNSDRSYLPNPNFTEQLGFHLHVFQISFQYPLNCLWTRINHYAPKEMSLFE